MASQRYPLGHRKEVTKLLFVNFKKRIRFTLLNMRAGCTLTLVPVRGVPSPLGLTQLCCVGSAGSGDQDEQPGKPCVPKPLKWGWGHRCSAKAVAYSGGGHVREEAMPLGGLSCHHTTGEPYARRGSAPGASQGHRHRPLQTPSLDSATLPLEQHAAEGAALACSQTGPSK